MLYGEPGRYMKTEVKEYAMNNETCCQKLLLKKFLFSSTEYEVVNVVIYVRRLALLVIIVFDMNSLYKTQDNIQL